MCFDTESINTNFGAIDDDADINTPLWTISNYDDEKMDEKSLGSEKAVKEDFFFSSFK